MTEQQNKNFDNCWKTCRSAIEKYIRDGRTKSADLFPRQHFVRDQCSLLLSDCLHRMDSHKFTALRFREGIENLFYLLQEIRLIDDFSLKTLGNDLQSITTIMGQLVEYYEVSEGFPETCWASVAKFFADCSKVKTPKPYLGRYEYFNLGQILGVGGFGVVHKAMLGNIPCCLKFVPPTMMPQLQHALADKQVASMINHPCLVKYYSSFMTKDAFVTCMEYIEGVDLYKLVSATQSGLDPVIVKIIVAQLGLALQHLHFKGFIHRDLKPENVLIMSGCRIKLIDFDTCKVCIGKYSTKFTPTYNSLTAYEFAFDESAGTVPFMPPEAFASISLGRSTDWWALGCVTFQLSTGFMPFYNENEAILNYNVTNGLYAWPTYHHFDPNLLQFVADCLRVDPTKRLCSNKYSDFQGHPYFTGFNFAWAESEPYLHHYPLLDQLIAVTLSYSINSPNTQFKKARLFARMSFTDLDQQDNIYCHSSPGFVRCVKILHTNKIPELTDINEDYQLLSLEEISSAPFVFQNFTKDANGAKKSKTRKPKLKTKKRGTK